MFKKTRNFKRIAVLLAAAIAVSPVSVPVHAEEIAESFEAVSEHTVSEDAKITKETADATTDSSNEDTEAAICSSDTTREPNELNAELLQKINEKIEYESRYSPGYWTSESGQNGYLFDITYHSTGITYPAQSEYYDPTYDNLDVHAVYDETTGIFTAYVSVNTTPDQNDSVAHSSDCIDKAYHMVSSIANNLSYVNNTALLEVVFEEGVTEIGEDFSDDLEGIALKSKFTFPESCTAFGEAAFWYAPFYGDDSQIEFIIKSDSVTNFDTNCFRVTTHEYRQEATYPIVRMPKQKTQPVFKSASFFCAQIPDRVVNMNLGKRWAIDGKQYASYFDNVTFNGTSLCQPVVIFGEHIQTDSPKGNIVGTTDGGNIIIFEGHNPFKGTERSPFNSCRRAYYFYPEKYADEYEPYLKDVENDKDKYALAYTGTLDDICDNLSTYVEAANENSGDKKDDLVSYEPEEIINDGDTINTVSSVEYTGKKIKIDSILRFKDSDGFSLEGKEVKIKYKNNKNVGTATYRITGIKSKRAGKAYKTAFKNKYADKTFTFEITPRKLSSLNTEITSKDGKIKSVKWGLGKKKKIVPKKMWTLDGTTIKFSGNFEGSVDASQYVGGSGS